MSDADTSDASTDEARPQDERQSDPGRGRFAGQRVLDHFELVLALVLLTIVCQALIDVRDNPIGSFLSNAISGAALVVATRAAGARKRFRRAVDLLVLFVLVTNVLWLVADSLGSSEETPYSPRVVWVLAAALLPAVVAMRLVHHDVVTLRTVLGAVAAYLQIAVAFAFAFQALDSRTHAYFFGEPVSTTVYMYFSLETISTLGYGDFTPVTDIGRLVAMTEAVIGQVFLVTFVAMIVSRFAAKPAD